MRGKIGFLLAVPFLFTVFCSSSVYAQPIQWGGNGHYYQLMDSPTPLTWYEAENLARSYSYMGLGGHLVTYTSGPEETFVLSNFSVYGPRVWIGGTDEGDEGNWRWNTGETWSYTNWDGGEPNGGLEENCLDYDDNTDKWNDKSCSGDGDVSLYVVEYDEYGGFSDPIPTVSYWGMIVLSLLTAFSAFWFIRRKKRTV